MRTPAPPLGQHHRVPEPVPSLETHPKSKWRVDRQVLCHKEETRMKSNGRWRTVNGKTPRYGRRRERRWTPTRAKAQDTITRASPNSLETHLARKWRDIGHLRALSPWSNGWMGGWIGINTKCLRNFLAVSWFTIFLKSMVFRMAFSCQTDAWPRHDNCLKLVSGHSIDVYKPLKMNIGAGHSQRILQSRDNTLQNLLLPS